MAWTGAVPVSEEDGDGESMGERSGDGMARESEA